MQENIYQQMMKKKNSVKKTTLKYVKIFNFVNIVRENIVLNKYVQQKQNMIKHILEHQMFL